jgi:hypothetical protein
MKWRLFTAIPVLSAALACAPALTQSPAQPAAPETAAPAPAAADNAQSGPVVLDWTPPALTELRSQAAVKSSFSLDRTMLALAAGMVPDSEPETRQAINKLDGVSVNLLRFGPGGIADESLVEAVREAYHLRGWKHLVSTTNTAKSALHNGTTDLWLVVDGVNVRGAVALVETPKSLTLVTLKGDLSPVDLLHLRGHFGIPRFEGDGLKNATDR